MLIVAFVGYDRNFQDFSKLSNHNTHYVIIILAHIIIILYGVIVVILYR